jgi:hypothetical protein
VIEIKISLRSSAAARRRIVLRSALHAVPNTLVIQTNYQTHTPSVHPTLAMSTLFEIKLSSGKLATTSFQHREIICGARKSFLEFSLRLTILAEPVDLQK